MAICGVCKNSSNDESDVKCSGTCGFVFHADCIKDEIEAKKTRSSFKCKECRSNSSQSSAKSVPSSSTTLTKDCLIEVMEGFKKEVFSEINSFRTEINGLSESVQFVSNKIDDSNKLMQQLMTEFAQLKKDNEYLKSENYYLNNEVLELRDRMRNIEQYSRVNNIEVSGLPVTKDESVRDLLKDVGTAIGVEVQEGDISVAHRVPSYKKERVPAMIVQFTSRSKKEEWISKFRQKKTLTAKDVNKQFTAQRVYIHDHLSPENKKILFTLKAKCKDIGYAYAWCRDGKFFTRKADGDPVKRINCYEDIEKLK